MRGEANQFGRRLPIGAEFFPDGTVHFRVWAPRRSRVEVIVSGNGDASAKSHSIELAPEGSGSGYYSGSATGLSAGLAYGFRLDGGRRLFPDPASRFQPEGPRGLSQLVDPRSFRWSDAQWQGVSPLGQVIYEMHIGTFTHGGTWQAAARELPELARVGITLIEIMPVADFPGEFGWGYDGVNLFAPSRLYGQPDDFRGFVDEAHARGLGVILDVVYKHFGNFENSIPEFSTNFNSTRYDNEWGGAINFDGEGSAGVREFFCANAHYWIEEYHLDGLRFDATQAVHDSSPTHILTDVVRSARSAAAGRVLFLVAENETQDVCTIRPAENGGHGMDAVWNDDFHHSTRVRLSGHNEAYYSDYLGSPAELLAALKWGFLYQGQHSPWQKKPRGTPSRGFPGPAFVTFLQNHDQVANSGFGQRVDSEASPGCWRAMTTLWLLAPQTPMFFQGQEFASSAPFIFFADNSGEQAEQVARGRAKFLSQFPSLATPGAQERLASPHERSTFERCKLNFSERQSHREIYAMHIDLLCLRRDDPVFNRQRADLLDGSPLSPDALVVRFFSGDFGDRLLLVNFGRDLILAPAPQPLLAPPSECHWEILWGSERAEYRGRGVVPIETEGIWRVPGEAAVVLRAAPGSTTSPTRDEVRPL